MLAEVSDEGVELRATVATTERTGVEMEALTAVSVAGLAVVDMVKALDRGAVITDIRVLAKSGGRRRWLPTRAGTTRGPARRGSTGKEGLMSEAALVITVSTRAADGVYEDRSGPIVAAALVGRRVRGLRSRSRPRR